VLSVDLSLAMLRHAHALRPDAVCVQADMRALPLASQSMAAIVAFYSLIHIPPADMAGTLREIRRVLSPSGRFALAVHIGSETVHQVEMLGEAVDIDFFFFEPDGLARDLIEAGFTIREQKERDPNPAVEAETRRLYIVATP
jgi:SAM-dependent methyltransferase